MLKLKHVYLTYIVIMLLCQQIRLQTTLFIFFKTLIKEVGLDTYSMPSGKSDYTPCKMPSEDIISTHKIFIKAVGIELFDDQ